MGIAEGFIAICVLHAMWIFKAWPYQSWHLNAKENAGQACSSWGSCHQTIAMWNNGYITWIHWVQAESLLPCLPLSVFNVVPSTKSTIYKENASFPFFSFPILYEYFRGKVFVWVVRKCGKTRLQGRGESRTRLGEWNSFTLLRVKWYSWPKAREAQAFGWCGQDRTINKFVKEWAERSCLCPVVYRCIWVFTLCFLPVGSNGREITLSFKTTAKQNF